MYIVQIIIAAVSTMNKGNFTDATQTCATNFYFLSLQKERVASVKCVERQAIGFSRSGTSLFIIHEFFVPG